MMYAFHLFHSWNKRKGYFNSRAYETNRKEWSKLHSESQKGKHLSEEAKAKMSAAHKGKSPWNKGKNHSEETCLKISAAHKGKPLSAEHKTKISAANKGKPKSEEHKAKMSAAQKGKYVGKRWWHTPSGNTKQAKESPGPEWLLGRK